MLDEHLVPRRLFARRRFQTLEKRCELAACTARRRVDRRQPIVRQVEVWKHDFELAAQETVVGDEGGNADDTGAGPSVVPEERHAVGSEVRGQ